MTESDKAAEAVLEAQQAYELEEYLRAAEHFQAAQRSYQETGEETLAAEMANNRSVSLLQAGMAQEALVAVGDTPAWFDAQGDRKRYAMALGNKAAALAALDQKAEAEKIYWEAAQVLDQMGEKDLRASVLNSISRLQMGEGRYMEAIASMESGLEQVEKPSFTQRMLKRLLKVPGKLLNR